MPVPYPCETIVQNDDIAFFVLSSWVCFALLLLVSHFAAFKEVERRLAEWEAKQKREVLTEAMLDAEKGGEEISDTELIKHVRSSVMSPVELANAAVKDQQDSSELAEEQRELISLLTKLLPARENATGSTRDELGKGQANLESMAEQLVKITNSMAEKMSGNEEVGSKARLVSLVREMPKYIRSLMDGENKEKEKRILVETLEKIREQKNVIPKMEE